MSEQIYSGTAQYKLIYIFEIPNSQNHDGFLKIGEHSFNSNLSYKQLTDNCEELQKHAHVRIKQYTKTADITYNLIYVELARLEVKLNDGTIESSSFSDHTVHEVLDRSNFLRKKFYDTNQGSEWFQVNISTAKLAIKAVKHRRNTLTAAEIKAGQLARQDSTLNASSPPRKIILREEQQDCINKTKTVFASKDKMLWDCKMRFGKTVTAYALVKEMNYQKVLVVTHRPAVVDGWQDDFTLIFDDNRVFVTKANNSTDQFSDEDTKKDRENDFRLKNLSQAKTPFVYFASMQDLRGSKIIGGKFSKNSAIFSMDWDIIIYDEAHEGTQTELGSKVQQKIEEGHEGKKPKVLQLSGTPYNLYHQTEDTYSWDYVMEQTKKCEWDEKNPYDHNPYAALPELRICTFDLRNTLPNSYRYEDGNVAFNFREFFRTWTGDPERDFRPIPNGVQQGDFVYEDDVSKFLDLISNDSSDSNYPFATKDYREMFKHTFWILPGVKESRAFSALLKEHSVFKDYEIVNVAGEGDVEKPYDDALKEVRTAIKNNPRSITLSCGKLTTGVTVKEWTGVMLLSGSSNTGAAGYMQTIFRVQSAGSIDGKQKKVCYAFDFAPDRTLTVLSEVHSLKNSAVGTDETARLRLGEFLNFCPVLSEGDTGMEAYDVPKMMRQLKRLTVDAALKSGFDDNSIYKEDAGIVMDNDKIDLVDLLKEKLTGKKQGKKKKKHSINDQGLTDEQYKKSQGAKNKPTNKRSSEENELLKKEREMRKKQKSLFDLLRNISVRLPLLIYGTAAEFNESIRLSDFIKIVDERSWLEFMPKEVDKELFQQLLVFYDEDVIEGAGMRIRRLAKSADELMPTQRVMRIAEIFSYFRNPAKETVLTPWRIVNMHMGETLGGYNFYKEDYPKKDEEGLLDVPRWIEQGDITSNLFLNENARILELNSKSGLYPLYLTYTLYRLMLPKKENEMSLEEAQAVWNQVLQDHVFVLCQTTMAVSITKRTLRGYTDITVNTIHIPNLIEQLKQDPEEVSRTLRTPATWGKEGENMIFDGVVSNPPYNDADEAPIYPDFYNLAAVTTSVYTIISPARFLFDAGKTKTDWNKKMLSDPDIKIIKYEEDCTQIFPNTDIKGGVVIIYRQEGADFGAIASDGVDVYIPNTILSSIVKHVWSIEV